MNAEKSLQPVAIVTAGAGLGIGHGISESLAAAGWNLVITDRRPGRGEAFAKALASKGARVAVVNADVTEPDAPEKAVRAAVEQFGRLDGLVNNAGAGLVSRAGDATDEQFMNLFNVDFLAVFRFTRAALPALIQSKGAIVNIGSVHAQLAARGYALYAATKSALEAFTRGVALDYGTEGVRANTVHPGLVESPQNRDLIAKFADPGQWIGSFTRTRQCLPRPTSAADVGALVAFLLGPGAAAITGQAISIDGGTTCLLWDNEAAP